MYILFLLVCMEPSCVLARAGSCLLELRQGTHTKCLTQYRLALKTTEEMPGGTAISA